MSEEGTYYPTPKLILGDKAYAELMGLAIKVCLAKHGSIHGTPAIIFDGKGGSFVIVESGEER